MKNTNFVGVENDSYIFQETGENGLIRGFNEYYLVELVNGDTVLSMHAWSHNVELNGVKYSSGMAALPVIDLPDDASDAYACETVSCEECGAYHDGDGSTWAIVGECTAVCLGCRNTEQVMMPLENEADLFKAKNLDGIDLSGFDEIDVLFCDSSGFGSPNERALTQKQAEKRAKQIIEENQGIELFCGLTGIGQFQVYVGIFKKSA